MRVAMRQVLDAWDMLDSPRASGKLVKSRLTDRALSQVTTVRLGDAAVGTDFLKVVVPGAEGRQRGGNAPTLGIIGRLGGVGARPALIGLVSDADGAVVALAVALKLADMAAEGDVLPGDVIITTHICPNAPTMPRHPVPFMGSPVDTATLLRYEVDPAMDAILSVDTTRGNRVINRRGFAITPTVKEGFILPPAEDLLDIMQHVTGQMSAVCPLATQDITPYGNGLRHINSILQPATACDVPVVGVALTAEVAVPGPATGASQVVDIEATVRFCLEVAKAFTAGRCRFHDADEFHRLLAIYGSMAHLRSGGKPDSSA
jgi:hypothetical protein